MGKVDKLEPQTPRPILSDSFERLEDRRLRGERLYVSIPVIATYQGSIIQGFIEAVNLSWSGMLLATNFPLNLGDHLVLEFTLPNTDTPITAKAKVVHKVSETFPEEATAIGVAFEELEPNVQRLIAGFVLENIS